MEEDDGKLRNWTGAILSGVALVLVPMLYVLSIGLADRLLAPHLLQIIYYPVFQACEWSAEIDYAVDWYITWWTPGI